MAFTVPEFPITCEIWTGPWLSKVLRLTAVPCNLAWGKRCNTFPQTETDPTVNNDSPLMVLLLPALTDIRNRIISGVTDLVECPSGSGRWYAVAGVDDIGKGFPNEHRAAWLLQVSKFLNPTTFAGLTPPIPWP